MLIYQHEILAVLNKISTEHLMIKNLIKAAADLDAAGFIVEADIMDRIMQKVAGEPNFGFLSQKKTKAPAAKKPAKKKEVAPEEDDDEDMLASLQGAVDDDSEEEEDSDDEEELEDEEAEYDDEDEPGDISEEDEEDGITISAEECLEHCMMLSTDEKCALMKALLDSICEG